MSKTKTPTAYEIGYRKPPLETQFRAGASGNPKGRPKGSKNFESKVIEMFDRKIVIQGKGRPRRITMADAILMKLTAQAIAGDMSATRLAIGLLQMTRQESAPTDVFNSEADRALLMAFVDGNAPEPAPPPPRRQRKRRTP